MLDLSNLSPKALKSFCKLWKALDFITATKEDFYDDAFVNCTLWAFGLNPGDLTQDAIYQQFYDKGYQHVPDYWLSECHHIMGGFRKMAK